MFAVGEVCFCRVIFTLIASNLPLCSYITNIQKKGVIHRSGKQRMNKKEVLIKHLPNLIKWF